MELEKRHVVVTGGASGIGCALALAFAEAGARAVVVADVDADGAGSVAEAISARGGEARAVVADVAAEQDVVSLVEVAETAFGPVDIFCANAGILVTGGPEVGDSDWERIWAVNVMSHVYAARALVPRMLARGEGYLVHTASAAGLLTQLGALPYAVTKHAVVAVAEWLSITYGGAGVRVSCLCPQGVWTGMTRGEATRETASATAGRDGMLEATEVATTVLEAVRSERFLILPHPQVATYEERRASDRERWLSGMRRLQAELR